MGKYSQAASALEEAFVQSFPAAGKKKPTKADWAVALDRFNGAARAIRVRHKLGILGRAACAYQFQRSLLAKGHPPEVVRQILFSMVINAFVG